jgi:hypothetical protein
MSSNNLSKSSGWSFPWISKGKSTNGNVNKGKRMRESIITALLGILLFISMPARANDSEKPESEERIKKLEQMVEKLSTEVNALRQEKSEADQSAGNNIPHKYLDELRREIDEIKNSKAMDLNSWLNRLTIGGYGEMHANFGEGPEKDVFDIHRLVLYLGYEFSDWIQFHSETEIEHAFVSDDSGGELSLEQAYVDFLLSEHLNVRAGRVLTPLGIINKKHEPPLFNGVERPSFSKYIIPTTWSSDGIGIFGFAGSFLQYEVYVVGGLDGSEFNATDGIRKGRIKERPSLHEPAFTGRLDFYPLSNQETNYEQDLRLGLSGYCGGLDNGNQGKDPGIDGNIKIYSADFEYSVCRFDFRGAIADIKIDGAREIGNGTAEEIFGFYVEGAYHFWPDAWKTNKLKSSDAVLFVRFDNFDTQHEMPSGVSQDPVGDRIEWTMGVNFYPVHNFVIKADYQIRQNEAQSDLPDLLNLGLGWNF